MAQMTETMRQLVAEKHPSRSAVGEITGLSRTTIYSLMARGEFPRPVKLTRKVVAWPEGQIARWLNERAKVPG